MKRNIKPRYGTAEIVGKKMVVEFFCCEDYTKIQDDRDGAYGL